MFKVTYTDYIGLGDVVDNHPDVTFELSEMTKDYNWVNTLYAERLSLIFAVFKDQQQDSEEAWAILDRSVITTVNEGEKL